MIYASPLTRATQTCLLGLRKHPTIASRGVKLTRVLREVRNIGGLDTIGKEKGNGIMERVRAEMAQTVGADVADDACSVRVDASSCQSNWWTPLGTKDTSSDLENRMRQLMTRIRFDSPSPYAICVGHSLFFRELARAFISSDLEQAKPELSHQLQHWKLGNAACLALQLDFAQSPRPIVDAHLLFGSTMIEE
jgi:broad specificity phosphatase PhoE